MANYIEQATFIARDEASRPISAINKALQALNRTQEKLRGRDLFEHMHRGLGTAKTGVEGLVREYERLSRAATAAGRAMNSARPRAGRNALADGREGRRGGAASLAQRDLAAARRGTAALLAEERRARIETERNLAAVGRETTAAMHRASMAAIAEEKAARLAALKAVQDGTRAIQREEQAAAREKAAADRETARVADRERTAAARQQEQASRIAEREAAAAARRDVVNRRRDDAAQDRVNRRADREARRQEEHDRRSRFRFSFGRQTGEHGYHAHLAHTGIGVGGLSLPGAVALQAGTNAGMAAAHEAGEAVKDLSNQLTLLKAEGLTKDIPRIEEMASRVSARVPEISKPEAIGQFREQFGLTFDTASAIRMTEQGAERASVLKTAAPNVKDPTLPLAKATENFLGSALLRPEGQDFAKRLQDQFAQTLIAEKGQLQPNDIKQMIQQSGGSLRAKYPNLFAADPAAREEEQRHALAQVGRQFPILAMQLGGASTGTMFNSMARAFNGRMTNAAKGEFEDAGLIDKSKIISRDKKGNPDKLGYGAFVGSNMPIIDYVREKLIPSMKSTGNFEDVDKRNFFIDKLMSNQKAAKGIKILVADMEQMEEGLKNAERMKPIHEIYADSQKGDIGAGQRAAKGSLDTMSATYLQPLIPAITGAFQTVAAGLIKASQAGENNTATKLAAGAGGATLAAGGVAARYIIENPGQSANTAGLFAVTRALWANSAAVSSKGAAAAAAEAAKTAVSTTAGAVGGGAATGGGLTALATGVGLPVAIAAAYGGVAYKYGFGGNTDFTKAGIRRQGVANPDAIGALPGVETETGRRAFMQHTFAGRTEANVPPNAGQARYRALLEQVEQDRRGVASSFGVLPRRDTFASSSNAKAFAAPFGGGNASQTAASLANSFQPIAASINQGAATFTTAADSLPGKGSAFGEQAGSSFAGIAGGVGSAIGNAFAAIASGIRISVDTPKTPNTGSPPAPE